MRNYSILKENASGPKPALIVGLSAAAEYLGVSTTNLKQFLDEGLVNFIKLDRQYFFRETWLNEINPTNPKKEQNI